MACGAAQQGPSKKAAPSESFNVVREKTPHYNGPTELQCSRDPIHARLFEMVLAQAKTLKVPAPKADGRLCRVADALVSLMQDGAPPPHEAVEFALSQVGVVEPAPNFIVLMSSKVDAELLAGEFSRRLAIWPVHSPKPRMGVGTKTLPDGGIIVGLVLQDSFVHLAPLLREVATGVRPAIEGKLLAPYDNVSVLVTSPAGRVTPLPLETKGREFKGVLVCDSAPGRYQLEIMGRGPEGPSVLANFPIYCGQAAPSHLEVAPWTSVAHDEPSSEQEIFGLLNADRARAGLAPLTWSERAADVARAHSREMRDKDFVAHVSPTTGDVLARVRKAGIRAPMTLENLARAYSPVDVHRGLMNSPGHRQNILHPDATHVGIGVALDGDDGQAPALYVTQVFLREMERLDPKKERQAVLTTINQHREQHRGTKLPRDEGLERVAQEFAQELAKSAGNLPSARREALLARSPERFRGVSALVGIVASARDLASDAVLAPAAAVGVGVAQAAHPTVGDNALYVVVLLAE